MFEIVYKSVLAPAIISIKVLAPEIAAKARPGQFIILRIHEKGERIPLTVADYDRQKGTISLIFQEVGRTTKELGKLEVGDKILDLVGPLGQPTHIDEVGTVVCIGGGVGIAPIYPITRAFKEAGNEVISIIGARCADYLILQREMETVSDRLLIACDDGSAGEKGFVTDILQKLLDAHKKIDLVMAVGPIPMMKAVAEKTRGHAIKTMVSMNPIMVDGTGMCGACRLQVGNETRFACIDGPDFDAHLVDWSVAALRANTFKHEEKKAMQMHHSGGECHCHHHPQK
jgi:ferredoxin--NADP+ reductase